MAITGSNRIAYAKALEDAEREYSAAQEALRLDDSNENRARYAAARAKYDGLQNSLPFVGAGGADVEA